MVLFPFAIFIIAESLVNVMFDFQLLQVTIVLLQGERIGVNVGSKQVTLPFDPLSSVNNLNQLVIRESLTPFPIVRDGKVLQVVVLSA